MSMANAAGNSYRDLRKYLDAPPPRAVDGGRLGSRMQAQLPPLARWVCEGAGTWELPVTFVQREDVRDMLGKVPVRQCVFCAAIAAEMALPIYFTGRQMLSSGEFPTVPALAIATLFAWVDGELDAETSGESLQSLAKIARDLAGASHSQGMQVAYAAQATACALRAAIEPALAPTFTMQAAFCFADAAVEFFPRRHARGAIDRIGFYVARWWENCKSRLAFFDAPLADLL